MLPEFKLDSLYIPKFSGDLPRKREEKRQKLVKNYFNYQNLISIESHKLIQKKISLNLIFLPHKTSIK